MDCGARAASAGAALFYSCTTVEDYNTCKNDALKTPLAFDPGERWEYGINIDWAGKMVEKVSGERLESYFHEHIFGRLGMTDTSFWLSPSQRTRLVAMHAREAYGSLKAIDFEMPQDPEFFMGGGGLYSTGPDYLKFVRMFLNQGRLDGAQVLRPETVALMWQNQIGGIKNVAGVILMQLLPFADPQALLSPNSKPASIRSPRPQPLSAPRRRRAAPSKSSHLPGCSRWSTGGCGAAALSDRRCCSSWGDSNCGCDANAHDPV